MMIYFTVQPRGSKYRVVDYEGKVIGTPFDFRDSAQSYANALNQARKRRGTKRPISPAMPIATPLVTNSEARPSSVPAVSSKLMARLQSLSDKVLGYKMVRLGL